MREEFEEDEHLAGAGYFSSLDSWDPESLINGLYPGLLDYVDNLFSNQGKKETELPEKLKDTHFKTALIVGRFQPFHPGHRYLLEQALKMADNVVIGIGSANANPFDAHNPLPPQIRETIIKRQLRKEQMQKKDLERIKFVYLEDKHDDKKWFDEVINKAGKIDAVIGKNDRVNGIFEKYGKNMHERGYPNYIAGEEINVIKIDEYNRPENIATLLRYKLRNRGILRSVTPAR